MKSIKYLLISFYCYYSGNESDSKVISIILLVASLLNLILYVIADYKESEEEESKPPTEK